ncbi:MAG: zinc ABC transporter substrate-binding protein [Clostridiales bacterium]|nr:zinc ABC transporter substrate-binding protein [Clostridiales bacterium]
MKRLIAVILSVVMVLTFAASCSSKQGDSKKLKIVTTIFPEYDWVMNLLGDNPAGAEVTMLLDKGVDLHSFQPTVDDIITISSCDLFIYVGGESDAWVHDALKEAVNKDMVVLNLMEVLGSSVVEEEEVPGMQAEEEEEEEGEVEYDEHIWLSLKNAKTLCGKITESLKKIDSANASVYDSALETYKGKLDDLDGQYQKAVSEGTKDTLIFGDRFPFRYMTDDYKLKYYAAFKGCSAESEASFETIVFLAGKADELGISCILKIENSDGKIAQSIIDNSKDKNRTVLSLDSMQGITGEDVKNGKTYLGIMESNLETLKGALK